MRFFAIFLLFAFVLAVSAAPRNVPSYDPETAAEFNAQNNNEKRTWDDLQKSLDDWVAGVAKVKRDLQSSVHAWLHPEDSKLKKRGAGESAFGVVRDWKTMTEKKFGLVSK